VMRRGTWWETRTGRETRGGEGGEQPRGERRGPAFLGFGKRRARKGAAVKGVGGGGTKCLRGTSRRRGRELLGTGSGIQKGGSRGVESGGALRRRRVSLVGGGVARPRGDPAERATRGDIHGTVGGYESRVEVGEGDIEFAWRSPQCLWKGREGSEL